MEYWSIETDTSDWYTCIDTFEPTWLLVAQTWAHPKYRTNPNHRCKWYFSLEPGLTRGYLRVFNNLYLQKPSNRVFFLLHYRKQGNLQTQDCWDYRPLKGLLLYIQRGIDGMIPQKLTFVKLVVFLSWGLFVYWIRFEWNYDYWTLNMIPIFVAIRQWRQNLQMDLPFVFRPRIGIYFLVNINMWICIV